MADPTVTVALDTSKALGVERVSDCLSQQNLRYVDFVIGQIFGSDKNLNWLEENLESVRRGEVVEDETVVAMAWLYVFVLRVFLNDPVAADLLLYYLNQQSPSQFEPTAITLSPIYGFAIIPTTSVRSVNGFDDAVMIAVMTKLERALQMRFDNPTQLFPILNYGPVQSAYFMQHNEVGIEVVPALSPLIGGGTETIYGQANVTLDSYDYAVGKNGKTYTGIPKGIVQALGTVTINFEIQVTSTVVVPDAEWTVRIDSWNNWLEDDGNFIDGHISKGAQYLDQSITGGISALKDSDDRWVKFFALYIENTCPQLVDLLDRFKVTDMFMDKIMNRTITLSSGEVFSPREFKVYSEPWTATPPDNPNMFRTEYQVGN